MNLSRILPLALAALFAAPRPAPAATVTWTGRGDGRTWSQAANWDANRLPAEADDAVLPAASTTVEHRSGATRIRRLVAAGGLRVTGGSITLLSGISSAGGAFLVEAGGSLSLDGPLTRLAMEGTAVAWEGSLRVSGGAVADLSRVVQISGRNPDWSAEDAGSLIDARSVTNIALPLNGWFPLRASGEARILLSTVPALRGAVRPSATQGGLIDLGGVRGRWSSEGFAYRGELTALEDGRIVGLGLTELDLVDVELDAPRALPTLVWTALTRGTLRIRGGTPDFGKLANLDDTHLAASGGAQVLFPALRQVRGRNPDWIASDPDTRIDANGVTSVGLPANGWFPVTAENQGRIELRGLTALRGPVRPTATTEGVIDLAGLSGEWSSDGFTYAAELTATKGGRLLCPGLTGLDGATVELDATGFLATGTWTTFTRGVFKVTGAAPDLSRLANLDDTHLEARDGASLRLFALRTLRGRNPDWSATDLDTLIEARGLATLGLTAGGWFPVTAQNQARIDLGTLSLIRGPLRPQATTGGIIDLSGLTGTWSSEGFTYPAVITAVRGGRILCPRLTALDYANVELDATGSLPTAGWNSFTRGTLEIRGAQPDLARLKRLDEADLQLSDGAVVLLPALKEVAGRNPNWSATGAGTLLDAGSVTNVALPLNGWFPVTAANQAEIRLDGLTQISGPLRPTATGGATVDLRGLRGRWSSEGFAYPHILSAGGGGRILAGGIVSHVNGDLAMDPGGVIPTEQILQIRDGQVVADGVGAVLSFPNLKDQTGTRFEERNGGRIVFSGLPRIQVQPSGARLNPGTALEIGIEVVSDTPVTFQWLRNGQPIRGAQGPTLRFDALDLNQIGAYSVIVANAAGSVESDPALLSLLLPALPFADRSINQGRITAPAGLGLADNLGATREPGEPRHAGKPGGRSVWIAWVAPTSGSVAFRTTGSTFDTLLAIYTRNRDGTLTEVASDEDSGGFLNSQVRFPAVQGTEYSVCVDGYAGASGTIVLSWDLDLRLAVFPEIVRQPADTLVVSGEAARLSVAANPPGVLFQWFFRGRALPGENRPELDFAAATANLAGAYHVAVSLPRGTSVVSRTAILEVADRRGSGVALSADKLADLFSPDELAGGTPSPVPSAVTPPAVGLPGSQWTDNTDSSRSPDEPSACSFVTTASRWFRLRFNLPAGVTQPVRITTTGSEIASFLAVFTNNTAPVLIACDRAEPPQTQSAEVTVGARRNVDYLVLVDGLDGARGKIQLNWSGEELPPPEVRLVDGRLHLQMRVSPGIYDWQASPTLGAWSDLFRTNITTGIFEFHAPAPPVDPAGFYRLLPAP